MPFRLEDFDSIPKSVNKQANQFCNEYNILIVKVTLSKGICLLENIPDVLQLGKVLKPLKSIASHYCFLCTSRSPSKIINIKIINLRLYSFILFLFNVY